MSHENGFSTHRTQGNDCNCIEPITRITSFSIPGALKAHHCSETLPGYCCLPAVSGREVERNHWQNLQNFKKKKITLKSQAWRYSAVGSDTPNSEKQLVQKVHTWPQEPGWAFTCRWQVLSFAHFAVLSKKKVKATRFGRSAYLRVYPPSLLRPCGTGKNKHMAILKSEVVCKTAIFSSWVRKSNDCYSTEHCQCL